jgi:cytochrome c biogenesis protein ResB
MKTFLKKAFRFVTSTQLALIMIIFLIFCMILGTVFPQGGSLDEYIKAFGHRAFVRLAPLGILDIFHAWYFIAAGIILYLNLFLGMLRRVFATARKRSLLKTRPENAREIPVEDFASLQKVLRKRGFRCGATYEDARCASLFAARGVPRRWTSIFYHLFFGISIFGFLISALTKFDGNIDLEIGDVHTVPTSSDAMALYRIFREYDPESVKYVEVELKDYEMQYLPTRMGYFPKDYISTLVVRSAQKEKEMCVEVNRPLKFAGLTFFQWSYGQRFELEAGEETLSLEAGDAFTIDGIAGRFRTRTVFTGEVFTDSGVEDIVPYTKLLHSEGNEWQEVAELVLDEPVQVMGRNMVLRNVKEVSGIHYVRDDGVPLLSIGFLLFMVGLCLRVFAHSYEILLFYDKGNRRAYVKGTASGIGRSIECEVDVLRLILSRQSKDTH